VSQSLTRSELEAAGEALGRSLQPGDVVTFEGELGAGKTTLIQAVVRGLGVRQPATSPTYSLVHRYQGARGPVFHLDCFRLRAPEEAADLDWEGLLAEGDAILVEWVPRPAYRCRLSHLADPARRRLEAL
jgi:tRNA threonylcarbamoyladenosine biosynthesis protein TsaE